MNDDAQEAALGLLGLSPTNLRPTIPLKRKQAVANLDEYSAEAIHCICGFTYDDGFSIACDDCSRWSHAACFEIVDGASVPEEWRCWECVPRAVDREKAVRLQRARLKQAEERQQSDKHRRRPSPGTDRKHRRVSAAIDGSSTKRKRRLSIIQPNEEEHVDIDEPWSSSFVHITQDIVPSQDTRVKLRRQAQHWRGVTALTPPSPFDSVTPVRLSPNEPMPTTTVKALPLNATAHPALSLFTNLDVRPPTYAVHTTTPIQSERLITPYTSSITPSSAYLSDPLNSYAHLGMPKPFVHLVGPPLDLALDSRIAGDKSRFVRSGCRPNAILRPVLCDRSLDNTSTNSSVFPPDTLSFGIFALRDLKANEEIVLGWEWDDGNAVHSLPALIQTPHMLPTLSNDSNSPHEVQHLRNQLSNILHALSSTFTTCACGARAKDCALTQMAAFVDGDVSHQASSSSRVDLGPLVGRRRGFMTREREPFSGGMSGVEMCVESAPVEPLPDFILSPASPSPKKSKGKGKEKARENWHPTAKPRNDVSRGRSTATRGLSQLSPNMFAQHTTIVDSSKPTSPSLPSYELRPPDPDVDQVQVEDVDMHPELEEKMPPKMRKRWIHRESEALRESNGRASESPSASVVSLGSVGSALSTTGLGIRVERQGEGEDVHHSGSLYDMPPPPMPASIDPTTISSVEVTQPRVEFLPPSSDVQVTISPSSSFAKLSLLSPIVGNSFHRQSSPEQLWSPFRRSEEGYFPTTLDSQEVDVDQSRRDEQVLVKPETRNRKFSIGHISPPLTDMPPPPIADLQPSETIKADPMDVDESTAIQLPPPSCTNHDTETSNPEALTPPLQSGSPIPASITHIPASPPSPSYTNGGSPMSLMFHTTSPASTHMTTPPSPHQQMQAIQDTSMFISQTTDKDRESDQLSFNRDSHSSQSDQSPPRESTTQPPTLLASSPPPPASPPAQLLPSFPTSQLDSPHIIEHPPSPPVERPASPTPMPKVKMSLKDFVLRKKKQKEEQTRSMQASPMSTNSALEGENIAADGKVISIGENGSSAVEGDMEDGVADGAGAGWPRKGLDSDAVADRIDGDEVDTRLEGGGIDTRKTTDSTDLDVASKGCRPAEVLDNVSKTGVKDSWEYLKPAVHSSLDDTTNRVPVSTDINTRQAKVEFIEHSIPKCEIEPPCNINVTHESRGSTAASSPAPPADQRGVTNHVSREDGEIIPGSSGTTPPPPPNRIEVRRNSYIPRSHSPPTQPRSFQVLANSSPSSPSIVLARRPSLPPYRTPPTSTTPTGYQCSAPPNARPLPVAPRALRNFNLTQQVSHQPPHFGRSHAVSSHIPRGPSADRDRQDWDRGDRWPSNRSRTRGGGAGWNR